MGKNHLPQRAKTALLIGHRGAAGLAPENTLAAFRRACEMGVDAVELDVLLTIEGKAVVHHDYTLKPEIVRGPDGNWITSTSKLAINTLTLDQLQTYDVGRLKPGTRYSRRYPDQKPADGERIPSLQAVIALYKRTCNPTAKLWIEIKTSPEKPNLTPQPALAADTVIALVRKEKVVERVRILSFDWRTLAHVHKTAPDIPTVYLSRIGKGLDNIKPGQPGASPWTAGIDVDDYGGSIPRAIHAAGGRYWAPYYKYLSAHDLKVAHELGIQVYAWTVDAVDDMVRLIQMGVDGIISNRPDLYKKSIGGMLWLDSQGG